MLSGAEKTALMLLLLEEPEAAGLLSRLDPAEVETVGRAMLSVAEATPSAIDGLLDQVLEIARETVPVGEGPPTTRDLLIRSLGDERAGGIIDRLGEEARPPLFERLQWLEPYALASLLEGEHPQTRAFVLAQLPPQRGAQVLARIPVSEQPDLVRRVATLGGVTPHAAEALDFWLSERITAARPRQPITDHGGMQRAAELINMAGIDSEAALALLTEIDPTAANTLSETLFTFADIARLEPRDLQTLLRGIEAELLVPALRGATPELAAKLLAAMPVRAAEVLRDEIEGRGPIKRDDAVAAQKRIASAARQLGAEGTISLPGRGSGFV